MKKTLIAVTALLLAGGLTSPAMAAEFDTKEVITSVGNQILVDYSQGNITKGMSFAEANKALGKVDVPKDSNLTVALNYNSEHPASFSLCAWDGKDTSSDKAVGYLSINGNTTESLVDCKPFAKNTVALNPTADFTPVERPILNTADFGTEVKTSNEATAPVENQESKGFPLWLGILIALAVLAVAGFGIFHFATKGKATRRKERDEMAKKKSIWEKSTKTHDKVQGDYANYLADPVQVLNYPKLNDKTDPVTKSFLSDLGSANTLRPDSPKVYAYRDPSDYTDAVTDLDVSWTGALEHAKTVRWKGFSADEIERLKRAQSHLSKVLDPNGNENERQISYRQLLKEIKGLIVLPKTSLLAIEKKSQLQLQDSDFYKNAE